MHSDITDSPVLQDWELSALTEAIPLSHAQKFIVRLLKIKADQVNIIKYNCDRNHHDTLLECLSQWQTTTEARGLNARDELKAILQKAASKGWIRMNDVKNLLGPFFHQKGQGKDSKYNRIYSSALALVFMFH